MRISRLTPFAQAAGLWPVKPLTFIHTADCHLDAPFLGVAREDEALARRLRESQRKVFDDLIALCIERKAAFLLIGGDLYDVAERSLHTRVRLRDAFRKLGEAGIEVFLATGNHDNLAETQTGLALPPNVHIFPPEQPETFLWPGTTAAAESAQPQTPVVPSASITGISYGWRAIEENLALRFPPPRGDTFNIAVLHCNVEGDPTCDNYAPCRLDDLLQRGYSYWALGHVHAHRILAERPATVLYPGCIQGRNVTESGEKGAAVVTVDAFGGVHHEFVPLNRIEWAEIAVDVSDAKTAEELAELFGDRAGDLAANASSRIEGIIVRWRLTGQLHCDTSAQRKVLDLLRETAFEREPFVWTETLDAAGAVLPVDWTQLLEEPTPRGDLVRQVRQIRDDPEKTDKLRDWLLQKSAPPDLVHEVGDTLPLERILDEATRLGLELLGRPVK